MSRGAVPLRGAPPVLIRQPAGDAREVAALLVPGGRVCALTRGQWSLGDLLRALLERTGPAEVTISTWTAGIRDAEAVAWLVETGGIASLRLIVDRSFPSRQPQYVDRIAALFGASAIRVTRSHAKFALIRGGDWRLVVRSSMNLNQNRRFEQADIDDDAELFAFFDEFVAEVFDEAPPGLVEGGAVEAAFRRIMPAGGSVVEVEPDLVAEEVADAIHEVMREDLASLIAEALHAGG